MKTNLKYPLYLFIAIFVAKLGYVVVESFYNYYILTTTTQADVTKEVLEELNENGHLISAFGLTVLLVPFVYLFVKKRNTKVIYKTLALSSVVTFFLMYSLLNVAVDKIVEINKEQRYNAFYITTFKYGLLNNRFAYNSFIDNKKVVENKLDVNDKILLTNSFLLLHADQKLIEKLKQRGKEVVADMYIEQRVKDDYDSKFKAYKKATTEIANRWIEFNKAREELNLKLKKLNDKSALKKAHTELKESLKSNYNDYKKGWREVDILIEYKTSQDELKKIGKKLSKYFKYKGYKSAEEKYTNYMLESFGHYIEPTQWKDSNNELTYKQIKKVIVDEMMAKAEDKLQGLPRGLSARQFAFNLDVKIKVAKKLKKSGISIPADFDYSFKQFSKYYNIVVNKKINKIPKQFYQKLEDEIGKNDLKLDITWKKFVHSNYIKKQVQSKLNVKDGKDLTVILDAIETKDLANFKKMIYLPKIIKKIEDEYEYTKDDFLDGHKASSKGDEAIKMLYIPPFALAVSILALILNLVTIFGMLLEMTGKVTTKKILLLKVLFVISVVTTPIVSKYDGFENPLIAKVSNDDIKTYLKFLNWLSFYESINSNLHKKGA